MIILLIAAALPLVSALSLAPLVSAQASAQRFVQPGSEGSLSNDVFLPTTRQSEESLKRGDDELAVATAAPALLTAFEAWRGALTASSVGDAVNRSERDTIGVELAVWKRLDSLNSDQRAQWTKRFEELAEGELADAGRNRKLLAEVARRNPATRTAVRACLRLADLELERGAIAICLEWCERARRHVRALESDTSELQVAVDQRVQVVEGLDQLRPSGARTPKFGSQWESATELKQLSRVDFRKTIQVPRTPDPNAPGPPTGIRSGLAFLDDGRIAVQSPRRVTIITATGAAIESSFEPSRMLPDSLSISPATPRRGDDRHITLRPVTSGSDIIVVHGRPFDLGGEPNALLSIRPPSPPPAFGVSRPGIPALNWAIVDGVRVDADGIVHKVPELEEFRDARFQNGPVIVGTRVLVGLRDNDNKVRARLACFDLASGEFLWMRLLAEGDGIQPGADGRGVQRPPNPSQPLAVVGTRVFVGTNIGAGLLVDVVDGRLIWGFRNRRRAAGSRGWTSNWPPAVDDRSPSDLSILWAPTDSDFEYLLSASQPASTGDPLLRIPNEIGEGIALLGGDREHSITLSLAGARRVVSSRQSFDGARFDSPYLGREETFRGAGAVSPERVLFSSDRGLYLLDRSRELFLLDYQPLSKPPHHPARLPAGGDVHSRGSRVFVLGEASLWTFLAQ